MSCCKFSATVFESFSILNHTNKMQNDEGYFGHSGPMLHNLVYCSRAAIGVDAESINKIIAAAKYHNPRFGITGLLVFGSGIFFQWLEGPRDNIISLMKIINADPRHSSVVLLSEENEVRDRLFPDWDMELVEADDIRDVLVDAEQQATDKKQKKILAQLLDELDTGSLGELSNT